MSIALAFWVLMLVWLVLGLAPTFGWGGSPYAATASTLLLFVLFLLLGWHVFGVPLHP